MLRFILFCFSLLLLTSCQPSKSTLQQVQQRGYLNCGVSTGFPGFSDVDKHGRWSGFDVDFCRAVAADTLQDADAVRYFPLTTQDRFNALSSGEVDLLARNTTWTISRTSMKGINFAVTNFYDAQAVMVANKLPEQPFASPLNGLTICVLKNTTSEVNLADYLRENNINAYLERVGTLDQLASSFKNNKCQAVTSDHSQLFAIKEQLNHSRPSALLPLHLSKEPLSLAVGKDQKWRDIVRWVVMAMINAEELDINQQNINQLMRNPPLSERARLLGLEASLGPSLGLDSSWAYNVINQVGNYGEVYLRHFGQDEKAGLSGYYVPRGLNALWTDGGLIYGLPMR